jgi:signal transduction histidine kinase
MAESRDVTTERELRELAESMQAAVKALQSTDQAPAGELVEQIQAWQTTISDLAGNVAKNAELAALHDLNRVLNSSLDLPDTLNLVMESLIRLTGAERGCLMLEADSGELVIEAARNFDQESIEASDLEVSHTVVEEAIDTGEPVLTTNAQMDPRFSGEASIIGYHLRSIVCVPLRARGRVIGALYLDNHIREGVFSSEDLPTLTTFANQAAIAIENARLYTETDQALAARVDELTTLQRIDRELNRSLDFDRVLNLTLSWALDGTRADSGVLCIPLGDGETHTVRASKYETEPTDPGLGEIKLAMQSSEPIAVGGLRLLVPIRLEQRTIGFIDLRSRGIPGFRDEHKRFAGRLADHAAVAIENARLYEEVRRANLAKSEFVSFLAHELRTPISSVIGYGTLLADGTAGPLTPKQQEFLDAMQRNVNRMELLVSDLQDISRIEAGRLSLDPVEVSMETVLRNAMQTLRAQIDSQDQTVDLDIPDTLPPVEADPMRLGQVVSNLLSNAHKYTPVGGRISISAQAEDGCVACAISDTGIGISEEDQEHIFDKFFRAGSPAVESVPGTGLGLSIAKSLVEIQGGSIEVESELGEGSTFRFTVPLASADEAQDA